MDFDFSSALKYLTFLSTLAFAAGYQVFVRYYFMLDIPWNGKLTDTPEILYAGAFCLAQSFSKR